MGYVCKISAGELKTSEFLGFTSLAEAMGSRPMGSIYRRKAISCYGFHMQPTQMCTCTCKKVHTHTQGYFKRSDRQVWWRRAHAFSPRAWEAEVSSGFLRSL